MPRDTTIDIPHVRFTDHYIRIVKSGAKRAISSSPRLLCATESAPDSALIGHAYLKWHVEGEEPSALGPALTILARHPEPAALAQALYVAQQPQQALPWAEKALANDSSLLLLELRGYLLEATGRMEEAINWWEKVAQKAPSHPDALFRKVVLAAQLERLSPKQAYNQFSQLLALQPFQPQYQYNAGLAAWQMGRQDLARAHWRQALQLDPDYKPAKDALKALP
jgi:tetratricopeptide (TPR) repeat protein